MVHLEGVSLHFGAKNYCIVIQIASDQANEHDGFFVSFYNRLFVFTRCLFLRKHLSLSQFN